MFYKMILKLFKNKYAGSVVYIKSVLKYISYNYIFHKFYTMVHLK